MVTKADLTVVLNCPSFFIILLIYILRNTQNFVIACYFQIIKTLLDIYTQENWFDVVMACVCVRKGGKVIGSICIQVQRETINQVPVFAAPPLSTQYYGVIIWQIVGFHRLLMFPPPVKLTAMAYSDTRNWNMGYLFLLC